jgi:hypothetical protein
MKRVIVHIDRLVLKGFRQEDRQAIAEGLRRELTRLLAYPTTTNRLGSLGNVARLQAGQIHPARDAKPQQVGVLAGRAIDRGLKR